MTTRLSKHQSEEAYASLMKGLKQLDLRGPSVPSHLVLTGDHAFPLAMNSQGQVLMAASQYGQGRIVVLGHESYLTTFPALVENALTWLRGNGSGPENLSVGIHRNVKGVADNLSRSSFKANVVQTFDEEQEFGVYVADAYSVGPDEDELLTFLINGGGLLIAGQAWTWAADHPNENTLWQFGGNKVSGVAGIYFSKDRGEVECLPVSSQIPSSWKALGNNLDFENDFKFLTKGISEFNLTNGVAASEVLVHGSLAFPIGITDDGRVFLAGAYYGKGRVVVISHEGLLRRKTLAPVWKNAIEWLNEGQNGTVGVQPALDEAFNRFRGLGFDCEKTQFKEDLSVYVCNAYRDTYAEEIQEFVAEGGGLLIGGHSWYWTYGNKEKNPMNDFPGNKIINKMGLSLVKDIIHSGSYKARASSQAIIDTYHFRHLLYKLAGHVIQGMELTGDEKKDLTKLGKDCANYLRIKAYDSSTYNQMVSNLTDLLKKSDVPQVSESSPVRDPKDRFLISMATNLFKVCPNPDELLPIIIKDNPPMPVVQNQKIIIDVKTAGGTTWVSTGLYLSPGMKTTVIVPEEIVNKGWMIQISCQTDYLRHAEVKRAPSASDRFFINAEKMQVSNLWGGLIYLLAPPKTQVAGLKVKVETAVLAPYYKSGVTTVDEWMQLRSTPSPWAELEFENIIITVPSEVIRDLDRPDELAAHWDAIMAAVTDLAATPRKVPRKERFVLDIQISHGWMHAGYPIMGHKPTASDMVSIQHAKTKGLWGPIHELGHNQQRGWWEFPPHTTECTCNIWSIYVHEEVLGINRAKAHPAMIPAKRETRIEAYVKGGRQLSSWSVFLALETYVQLQEKFGWDAFKKVFAAYHKMSYYPNDKVKKMNLYAKTFSKTVKMNLAGFFKAWGWPIEPATEEKLSYLPPWSDHPMVQYD